MAKLIIIGVIGRNRELGKDNKLIWNLKEDLKFFKEKTINHKIVMGYNTFKSLPGLLKKREHIVLTHKDLKLEGVKVFNNFEDLRLYLNSLDEDVYIIGGASIYKLFLPIAEEMLLTLIDAECRDADAFYPEYDEDNYEKIILGENRENDISYKHVLLRRIYEK